MWTCSTVTFYSPPRRSFARASTWAVKVRMSFVAIPPLHSSWVAGLAIETALTCVCDGLALADAGLRYRTAKPVSRTRARRRVNRADAGA
jgi:hypothetical protein